jgi:anti-sigma factor RsiW
MQCSQFEERLSDYFDGQLANSDGARFREHALQCRACRALMDEVKATLNQCHNDEAVAVPRLLESLLLGIAETHRPFDCAAFEALITEFLDGFVPAATYHRFEAHAADCDGCSGLLTEVVFAVAACHSVHTYEEVELPAELSDRLLAISQRGTLKSRPRFGLRVSAWAARLLPRATTAPRWSMATAAGIAVASFMLLLFGFSDDRTVTGIYRQAQNKLAQLYSRSTGIYAQKEALAARLERVGMGINEIWDGLGGEKPTPDSPIRQKEAEKPRPPQNN